MNDIQGSFDFGQALPRSTESTGRLRFLTAPAAETLADHLIERMRREPLPPHEFEVILLPHGSALRPWLTQRTADRLGCAASLHTPSVREFADALIRRHLSSNPAALDRHALTWRILAVVQRSLDDEELGPLRTYIERSGGRHMELSRRLAQLFDSYQTLRPELLVQWRNGSNKRSTWQAALWRHVVGADQLVSRGEQLHELTQLISEARPDSFPARISILGETVIPPVYLKLLAAIARHTEITWYVTSSVASSVTEGSLHPLVASLGEESRAFRALQSGYLRDASVQALSHVPVNGDSVLGRLQHGMLSGPSEVRQLLDSKDRSLSIHDCHSPIRELEVLRDQLLEAFEEIEGLRPSDVVIAVADLDRYGALIEAVFTAGDDSQRLPVSVARDQRAEGQRYLAAFVSLLDGLQSRMTAGAVLELLTEPAVGRRFGVGADDVDTVRWWIRQTRIRWGLDGDHRRAFGLPDNDLHTWKYGLDRLLMGLLAGESTESFDGVLPYAEATLDRAHVLERLALFLQSLIDARAVLTRRRTLHTWQRSLENLAVSFLLAESDDEKLAEDHLLGAIREILLHSPDLEVDFAAIVDHLRAELSQFEGRGRLLGGSITVADFERLRHLPARVLACVGLNDDAFPRRTAVADFDLIGSNRTDGDPDPRRLDKQTFLDTIISARDRLILTFNGRSQKDNAERAPSIVVDALVETLVQTHTAGEDEPESDARRVREHFVVRHPLQPFSPRYFDGSDARLFSYDRTNCIPPTHSRHRIDAFSSRIEDGDSPRADVVQLADLVAAWSDPGRFFCERLGVRLKLSDLTVEDIEPLFLDSLESYQINSRLVELSVAGQSDAEVMERLRREGYLPGGDLGRFVFEAERERTRPLLDVVNRFGPLEPLAIDIVIGDQRIVGTIPWTTESAGIHFRPASIRVRDRVAAWIHHLVVAVEQPEWTTYLAGKEGSGYSLYAVKGVQEPEKYLEGLVERFPEVLHEAPVILPESSFAYAKKGDFGSAIAAFEGSDFSPGECEDAFTTLLHRHHHPINDRRPDFEWEALWLFEPMTKYFAKEKL